MVRKYHDHTMLPNLRHGGHNPGPEVIKCVRKQPIIALYFEFETVFKFFLPQGLAPRGRDSRAEINQDTHKKAKMQPKQSSLIDC